MYKLRAFSALGQNYFGRTKNLKTDELDKILKADTEREKKKKHESAERLRVNLSSAVHYLKSFKNFLFFLIRKVHSS